MKKTNQRKKSNAKPTDPSRCSHEELLENCPDRRHRRPQQPKDHQTLGPPKLVVKFDGRNPHPFADIKAL